jgi:hypothetical protein
VIARFAKFILLPCLLVVLFCPRIYPQNFANNNKQIKIDKPEKELKVGEKLKFSLQWLGVPIGWIELETKGIVSIEGNNCYQIVARAFPNSFFRKIYNVEYAVNSFIDKKGLFTRRFTKRKLYNGKVTDVIIDFDLQNKQAKYRNLTTNQDFTVKALSFAQDLLSSLYYLRLQDLKLGSKYKVDIVYGDKFWNINAEVDDVKALDLRKLGTFNVVKVDLNAELSQMVLGKKDMRLFLTSDSRRIPVLFTLHTSMGPVRGIIQEIKPGSQWKNSS